MVFEAASHVTGFWRKYDSFAMWQAMAALLPKTASSVTGLRDFTAWKKTFKMRTHVVPVVSLVDGVFVERFFAERRIMLRVPLLHVFARASSRGS